MQYKYDDINRKLTDLQKKKLNQKNNTINVIRDVALLEQVTKEKDARADDPLTPPERRNMNMLVVKSTYLLEATVVLTNNSEHSTRNLMLIRMALLLGPIMTLISCLCMVSPPTEVLTITTIIL